MMVFFLNQVNILTRADISTKGNSVRYFAGAWLAEDYSTPKDIQKQLKLIIEERENAGVIHYI